MAQNPTNAPLSLGSKPVTGGNSGKAQVARASAPVTAGSPPAKGSSTANAMVGKGVSLQPTASANSKSGMSQGVKLGTHKHSAGSNGFEQHPVC